MNTRRRLGGKTKTNETKAAATGASIALIISPLKFSVFISYELICLYEFCANYCIIIYLCKKKLL